MTDQSPLPIFTEIRQALLKIITDALDGTGVKALPNEPVKEGGGADGMYRTYCFAAMTGFEMSNSGLMSGDTRDGIATYGITFGAPLLDTAEQLITLTVIALQGVIIQGSSGQASVKAGRYQGIDNSLQVWRYSLGVEVPFILPSPPVPYIPFKGGTVYQTLSPRIEPTETVDPRSPAPPLSSPILIVQAKPEESGDDN